MPGPYVKGDAKVIILLTADHKDNDTLAMGEIVYHMPLLLHYYPDNSNNNGNITSHDMKQMKYCC